MKTLFSAKNGSLLKTTYIKYFISYLFLFTILIFGFYFIMKSQVLLQYSDQQIKQAHAQLDELAAQFNDNLLFLSQVDGSLANDLSKYSYNETIGARYHIWQELKTYTTTTKLIDFIVYSSSDAYDVLSTRLYTQYKEEIFHFLTPQGDTLQFDPAPYFNQSAGQLIHLKSQGSELLIYFPVTSSKKPYLFFYSLDTNILRQEMDNASSISMPAIALITNNREIAVGTNTAYLEPYLNSFGLESGIYRLDDSSSICVHAGIGNGFSMISLISNESLSKQLNNAFGITYLMLLLLSILGFLFILLAMRITYFPLHKLTVKVVSNLDPKKGYIPQLESAFSSQSMQNALLLNKLNGYRTFMQKELLDSLINTKNTAVYHYPVNIDQFFDTTTKKQIYVVQIASFQVPLMVGLIWDYFCERIPGSDPCTVLEIDSNHVVFLINYVGTEPNKDRILMDHLFCIHEEYGYFCTMSNGTSSPLDIPSLYKNVLQSAKYWSKMPVVDTQTIPPVTDSFAYPYDEVNLLSSSLKEQDFTITRQCLDKLFKTIDQFLLTDTDIPSYLGHFLLIDVLTVIINCLGQSDVPFEIFNNLYLETLYFCRSYSYSEKAHHIVSNMYQLIDLYEDEVSKIRVTPDRIIQAMNEYYTQPDFSIIMLADKFNISLSHMSHFFKNKLNENFSDYLWGLRLNKAKELLKDSDMPIDKISFSVGYYSDISFRRKFKQATGMTPSQYRTRERLL